MTSGQTKPLASLNRHELIAGIARNYDARLLAGMPKWEDLPAPQRTAIIDAAIQALQDQGLAFLD